MLYHIQKNCFDKTKTQSLQKFCLTPPVPVPLKNFKELSESGGGGGEALTFNVKQGLTVVNLKK